MWARVDAQQPPEVLRVPLQQLCLTTKAALRAALPEGEEGWMCKGGGEEGGNNPRC
jgi:hypothetical protein